MAPVNAAIVYYSATGTVHTPRPPGKVALEAAR